MVTMLNIYRSLYTTASGEYRLVRSTTTVRIRKDVHRFLKRKAAEYKMTIGDFIYHLATGKVLPGRDLTPAPVGVIEFGGSVGGESLVDERPRGYVRRSDWHS